MPNPLIILLLAVITVLILSAVFVVTKKRRNRARRKAEAAATPVNEYAPMAAGVLEGLGGKENLLAFDHCSTRLRAEVKDPDKIDTPKLKASGAVGVLHPGKTTVQVVMGPKVQYVFEEFLKIAR